MKKFDIAALITGLVAFILAIIMMVVTIVTFIFAAKKQIGEVSFSDGIAWGKELIDDYVDTDKITIMSSNGSTTFDLSDGISVNDNGDSVQVADGEVYVLSDGDEVSVGPDGIHIESADGDKIDIGV